ncbi:MAG: WbqC family protein [Bacteroidota bacterium]
MPTSTVLIDLHHLPSLEYFVCLLPYHTIRLEAQETYQRQTYRNRCYILTAQKVDRLTIPVRKRSSNLPYRNIEIDYWQPWEQRYWRALCTAYRKAPYFEFFADYFRAVLLKRYTYLFDLNLVLLQTCLQLLTLDKKIELSTHYESIPTAKLIDARYRIQHHNRLHHHTTYYHPAAYQQVFGQIFHPNLSIIDLLFCKGHDACDVLRKSHGNASFQ